MHIALLTPNNAAEYRALMLEAYEQAADAFTSTAAERALAPESFWIQRIGSPAGLALALGAFEGERLVGTVALEFSSKPKTRHKALVIGMYVSPAARGQGAARALLQAAIEQAQARGGIERLTLTVTEGNEPALHLYRSLGFERFGVEPMAIHTPGGFKAKVHMGRPLGEVAVTSPLGSIVLYARDMQKTARFYAEHFGFETSGQVHEGLIDLRPREGGAGILIHQAAKSVKLGQVGVKLSFQVRDVPAFILAAADKGLVFGPVHQANGYRFANAKDPDHNPVSISSRAFRSGGAGAD